MNNLEVLREAAEKIIARYERKLAAALPVLHLVQARAGFISDDAEQWVAQLLGTSPAHVREVVTFYTMFRRQPIGRYHIQVCANISCTLQGSAQCVARLSERLGIRPGQTTADGRFTLSTVECLCACELAPMMQVNDAYVGPITPELVERLATDPEQLPKATMPFQGAPGLVEPVISKRLNLKDSQLIETYVRDDGYQMARKAVTEMTPDQIITEVSKANLRGLGGAGFPTGKKWSFIPKETTKPKFLVVNADEGEPGTIKDRYLIERDPHRLLEGVIIAAVATGCQKAYIYIRGEYVKPAQILQQAVEEAYKYGFLGQKIFNSALHLDVVVHRGAGAYICGEETALLTSLEGGKGFPRLKPPFPAISGLFGCPTVINNVETLACVPTILQKGGEWFAKLGFGKTGGTRLFSVSGHVNRPGLYEASQGVMLRELIFDYAGGIRDGHRLRAVIPGGVSAKILRADEIDVHMDFDSLLAAGTMAGSAGVIAMDETTCMVKVLRAACKFFAHESCGQCSPCREGTGWIYQIITRIDEGQGRAHDLETLLQLATNMEGKTICVFADAAAWPVQSYITKFRDEFEFHVQEKRCPLSGPPVETARITEPHSSLTGAGSHDTL
ncbi:MAG: NADH-quinone oxidoreductase subunit NuoF [Candidatus Omnitrophica bacterium]|nr:NADH-quinone oxidoreductase subunit NuoF [Candidatus Omnitrophota bacterium]